MSISKKSIVAVAMAAAAAGCANTVREVNDKGLSGVVTGVQQDAGRNLRNTGEFIQGKPLKEITAKDEVRLLQQALNRKGCAGVDGRPLVEDGVRSKNLDSAVDRFRAANPKTAENISVEIINNGSACKEPARAKTAEKSAVEKATDAAAKTGEKAAKDATRDVTRQGTGILRRFGLGN